MGESMETRRIVRFMATDLDGTTPVGKALRKIKGISFMLSNSICLITNTDPKKKIGDMSEEELKKLEEFIKNPELPKWMLNRRKDVETGNDIHITGATIDLVKREDINTLRRIRSYRGIRHEMGQPTRGQRTRSTFRTQKSVGVTKKSARAAPAPKKK